MHSTGIVIGHDCEIGDNFTVLQNVTMGQNGKEKDNRTMPKLGDNVTAYCLLGLIEIGNNVDIDANSVVTKNFEDNIIISGVPATILKREG